MIRVKKNANEKRALFQTLMTKDLLTFKEERAKEGDNEVIKFMYYTTPTGRKTYKALLDTVYSEIIKLK